MYDIEKHCPSLSSVSMHSLTDKSSSGDSLCVESTSAIDKNELTFDEWLSVDWVISASSLSWTRLSSILLCARIEVPISSYMNQDESKVIKAMISEIFYAFLYEYTTPFSVKWAETVSFLSNLPRHSASGTAKIPMAIGLSYWNFTRWWCPKCNQARAISLGGSVQSIGNGAEHFLVLV